MKESEFWKVVTVSLKSHYYLAEVTINNVPYSAASFVHEGEYGAKNKLLCELIGSGIVFED